MMIYLGGQLVAAAEARVDPWDRGLTLGDGLFETIAVRAGRVARREAHLSRLRDGADVKTLLQLVAEKTRALGFEPAVRVDLRFGTGPDGRIFLMNKHDGVVREVLP